MGHPGLNVTREKAEKQSSASSTIRLAEFDAAIFDLDGVVTRTARVHAAAWKKLFDDLLQRWATRVGGPFRTFDIQADYRRYVDGKPREEGVKSFLQARGILLPEGSETDPPEADTVQGLAKRKNRMFQEALHEHGVEVFDSTVAFIKRLRSQGLKTAVVTSSKNCAEILKRAGLGHLFDVTIDGHDVVRDRLKGKPAPDVFLKAAALLHVAPSRAMVFEDAMAGVEGARNGGFGLVVGLDRGGQADSLKAHGAMIVVEDVNQLVLAEGQATMGRTIGDIPSAFREWQEINRLTEGKQLLIFLDYDGTLTPIVNRPEDAVLSKDMHDTLKGLADRLTVVIVSGRDRADVERRVGLTNLIYAGSHGFDIAGPQGQRIQHEMGTQALPALDRAERRLRDELDSVRGAIVERKKFSIAVHYRLVQEECIQTVRRVVEAVVSQEPELRVTEGKKVLDLQPRMDWDKGRAVLWLLQALGVNAGTALALYIGDDLTDEAAFRALEEKGIGILVGDHGRTTHAHYALRDPQEVQRFLKDVTQLNRSSR